MVANKVQLINDGSLYCDEFIEDQSFPGEIKHKMYNDGRFSIEGELIEEASPGEYEDYTDAAWILADPNGRVSVATNTLTITDITKNEEITMTKDYGVDYFAGDFEHQFEISVPSSGTGSPTMGAWAMANVIDDIRGLDDANEGVTVRPTGLDESDWDLRLTLEFRGASNGVQPLLYNTTYYCTVTRDDDGGVDNTGRYVLTVYTDSARTNVFGTVAIDAGVGNQKDFRYLYACGSYNMSEAGSAMSATIANLKLVS